MTSQLGEALEGAETCLNWDSMKTARTPSRHVRRATQTVQSLSLMPGDTQVLIESARHLHGHHRDSRSLECGCKLCRGRLQWLPYCAAALAGLLWTRPRTCLGLRLNPDNVGPTASVSLTGSDVEPSYFEGDYQPDLTATTVPVPSGSSTLSRDHTVNVEKEGVRCIASPWSWPAAAATSHLCAPTPSEIAVCRLSPATSSAAC